MTSSVSAALLRRLADDCASLDELRARIGALPFAEVQALLRELAQLLETHQPSASISVSPDVDAPALPATASSNAPAPDSSSTMPAPGSPRQATSASRAQQSSFGFGGGGDAARAVAAQTSPRKLLLYSDGAARGNPGPAGAGAVLMKPDGSIVARVGKYLGRQTNNYAEYMALIVGLRAARDLGANEIEMVADSELLVKQIKKIYRVKNEQLQALYAEATELISQFQRASIRHVPREYNREADEMSNRAIDERM
ncbi:MAG: ribonuclease HI family protein [Myxococcales bacterium]|jgi:ribonuclease HI|nr:ribonuclease HI family protein [Myxococcales bacterium]